MVGLRAALNDPENKKPTPELLAHFLALGQAISTLGGVRAEKIAAAAVGRQEALTPEQKQEAQTLNEVENATKILQKQLEFLMRGSRSGPDTAAAPWNLKQTKDFQSAFVSALESRKRAHEKLRDTDAVKRDEAGIAAVTALFKKLDQVEALKQRAIAVGVAVPKTIDLPPPGFLEEVKDLIESLNT
jgi:hypothetical protein